MADLNMDAADHPPLDLSRVPLNFITMFSQSMSLSDRLKCALVCKAWADEATAATRSIILEDVQDLSGLQRWLVKHGNQVEVLQLEQDDYAQAVLTALPCPQLHDLLLRGNLEVELSLDDRVWSDIAAATKLTSVLLESVDTASQQADVVSALTALPNLEQLTWRSVTCGLQWGLTDSMLLQKLTKLTALTLFYVNAADALEHLGLLTRLQGLSLAVTEDWAAAGCPGLQELKGLTWLDLDHDIDDVPPAVSQLTALHQLNVPFTTPTALNKLSVLTGLTCLCLQCLEDLSLDSPPLQLPGLQDLQVFRGLGTMPMTFLANCTQLGVLVLRDINLSGPGRLVASSLLQYLELQRCRFSAADQDADPASWQQALPGPGRLPHLTSLRMTALDPGLQHADMECVVSCCSSLRWLHLDTLPDSATSALTLSGLTGLILERVNDHQCSSLAQLTGLRGLRVDDAREVFAGGLRQLATLEQLTILGFHSLGWSSDVLREHMPDRLPGLLMCEFGIINKVCAYVCVSGWVGGWVGWGGLPHSHCHPSHCCCGSRPRHMQLHQHHTSLPSYSMSTRDIYDSTSCIFASLCWERHNLCDEYTCDED